PDLMVMGTVRAMGVGCTCPANSLVKALLRHLVVERDEVVILDMEAGIEHLGRGTAEHVDVLLVISDANRKSLEIAGMICRLVANSAIKKIFLVGNLIANPQQEVVVRTFADTNGIEVLAMIPFDPLVAETGMSGNPLDDNKSPAFQGIGSLAETISSMSQI
ncbi:MAG: cobyrinic acid a,c-diamide synthase, partial [Methanomicrobiales archaeon]